MYDAAYTSPGGNRYIGGNMVDEWYTARPGNGPGGEPAHSCYTIGVGRSPVGPGGSPGTWGGLRYYSDGVISACAYVDEVSAP